MENLVLVDTWINDSLNQNQQSYGYFLEKKNFLLPLNPSSFLTMAGVMYKFEKWVANIDMLMNISRGFTKKRTIVLLLFLFFIYCFAL